MTDGLMEAGGVLLSVHPWVGGVRVGGWYGPVEVKEPVAGRCWEAAIDSVLNEAAAVARALSGNAVMSVEISVDPYHPDGAVISLKGTVARLDPLFAGVDVRSTVHPYWSL